ncbi:MULTISPECIES: hypothetical protein [Rhizobium]|uniref:hypothetical protein n=1 Tax=Rhizobium TaxID=379 RepID=UPI0011BFDD56|nr:MULTISPECIES: hypothetical protein [Rhizobium]MBB3285888.1 hypothetical protein [Rhizobium sp. BK252]MBB3400950.1 hypothetical protein [Rhizobium sp. BK289]MBB3413206.1 hypothetical protein [Rhizobium sp. BK284]MBB3481416.1 hypothetical protein [Rhizobium sp. BK347]
MLDGVGHVRELPDWHRRQATLAIEKEIGWSGLGSGSIRCFGAKRLAFRRASCPSEIKNLPRFRAAGEVEFDLERDVGADRLGLV